MDEIMTEEPLELLLGRAMRRINEIRATSFPLEDIHMDDMDVIVEVARLESRSIGEIARSLGIDRTIVSRRIAMLERGALVHVDRKNERHSQVMLTAMGARVLRECLDRVQKVDAHVGALLNGEAPVLRKLLLRLSTGER